MGPDIVVEAELGSLPCEEDTAQDSMAGGMADPDEAPAFLAVSEADLLAVAVGNVHSHYQGTPRLHWNRIQEISDAAGQTPLVLHGASGIPETMLIRAPLAGIGKININSKLRCAIIETLADSLEQHRNQGLNLVALLGHWNDAAHFLMTSAHGMATAELHRTP